MLTYLHGDHLGSASLATDASGTKITDSGTRYYPYGVTRPGLAGTGLPTDRRFTGQREEASLGFYDYGARQFDPTLGRFLQADTLVPEPGNPQSLNRYAYTLNNPLRYTDPSGHFEEDQIAQHLRDQGYSDKEIAEMIYSWSTEAKHKDWWTLLRNAQAGDIISGVGKRTGADWDRLWLGAFLDNAEGRLVFQAVLTASDDWDNLATFYSDAPLESSASIRSDLILARKGSVGNSYRFVAGTDLFADGKPDFESLRPDFVGEFLAGAGKALTGGTLMLKGAGLVTAGAGTTPVGLPGMGVGLAVLGLGAVQVKGGLSQMVGYFDTCNVGWFRIG